MGRPRSKATLEEVLAIFATDEPFKATARRIGMSPNRLREIWKAAFGEDAFRERGKRLQAKAAAEVCRQTASTRKFGDVAVRCSKCQKEVLLKSNQVAQMDVATFICPKCKYDMKCPVCGLLVDGERGLSGHFRHKKDAGDVAHIEYQDDMAESRWDGKVLDQDYVVCAVCGHRAESLARHLKAVHGIIAEQYKVAYPGSLIRSEKTKAKRRDAILHRRGGFGKGETKEIACPDCGLTWVGSKFLAAGMHDFRCIKCKSKADAKAEVTRWEGLSEPQDYVTCRECGYRAENLTSHIQSAHSGYREKYPDALVVSLGSAVRDKSAIRGVPRGPEFGERIREAKTLNLGLADFQPFLEPDGSVDQRAMEKATGYAWPTLRHYMDNLGLRATDKYLLASQEARKILLSAEQLAPFRLKNGKVSIARAAAALGYNEQIVRKNCLRLGITCAHGNISQRKCLDAISEALGREPFVEEWRSRRFMTSPKSFFRFDGYFERIRLLVEFQGYHHYTFPNVFFPNESYRAEWERKVVSRDTRKRTLVAACPEFHYLEVTEDEPFTDPAYLRGRLVSLGVLVARDGGIWLGDTLVWHPDL